MADRIVTISTITCPVCGDRRLHPMPEASCQIRAHCFHCGADMRPKPGDCCVFCSYGSVPCPPVQRERQALASLNPEDGP